MSIMNHGCDVSITPQFDKKKKKKHAWTNQIWVVKGHCHCDLMALSVANCICYHIGLFALKQTNVLTQTAQTDQASGLDDIQYTVCA